MRCHRLILVALMLAVIGAASGAGFAARESPGTPAARSAFDTGEAAARAGKLDEAVAAFRKAIAADPDFVDAHQRLIEVTQRQQLQDVQSTSLLRLKRQYEQWARQHPTRAVYQVALGLLAKDADQADAYFNKALAVAPSSASAHFLLARNADTRGDWDAQRKHLKAAVENNPDEPRYLLRYAVAHLKSDPARFSRARVAGGRQIPGESVCGRSAVQPRRCLVYPRAPRLPGSASRELSGRSLHVRRLRDEHVVRRPRAVRR